MSDITSEISYEFVKNNFDYSRYVSDFINDEAQFYDIIKSYTSEYIVVIIIKINDEICSVAEYNENGTVYEYVRNDEFYEETYKEYKTIVEWVNNYYGETVKPQTILNNVYIGEGNVPLWKILLIAKEEDDETNSMLTNISESGKCIAPIIIMVVWAFMILLMVCTITTLITDVVLYDDKID
jgi:hypothetical protein